MTKAQILTLLGNNINDNTNAEITPQDVRDVISQIVADFMHKSDESIGQISGGFWYASSSGTATEGDQRIAPISNKFVIQEYVSGSWTDKFSF